MKNQLLLLLNKERSIAKTEVTNAVSNADLVGKIVWLKYQRLIENLIKTIQDGY